MAPARCDAVELLRARRVVTGRRRRVIIAVEGSTLVQTQRTYSQAAGMDGWSDARDGLCVQDSFQVSTSMQLAATSRLTTFWTVVISSMFHLFVS
jgi:hypothetical protein